MTGIAEFTAARLDEDEAVAKAATASPWAWCATGDKDSSWAVAYVQDEDGNDLAGELDQGQGIVIDPVCESIDGHLPDAPHIARHDPARVLREVAAGRALLMAWHDRQSWADDDDPDTGPSNPEWEKGAAEALRVAVALRAAVWSDHPDYQPEWAPR